MSQLSSSKGIFYETASYYEHRLANCGYNEKLTYQQQGQDNKNTGKNRKRNNIGFKPGWSKSLKTNIGKYFLDFSTNIFNRTTNFAKILIKTL